MDENHDFWNTVYHKTGDIVSRKIADETLLVPIRGNLADMQRIFSINAVAEYIWQALDGIRPLQDIRDGVMAEFDADPAQCDADIRAFIDQLLENRLITDGC